MGKNPWESKIVRTVVCTICDDEFQTRGRSKVCSAGCRTTLWRRENPKEKKAKRKFCLQCEKTFLYEHAAEKYCSFACKDKAADRRKELVHFEMKAVRKGKKRACVCCENLFAPDFPARRYCSAACKSKTTLLRRAEEKQIMGLSGQKVGKEVDLVCRVCGDDYMNVVGQGFWCSDKCLEDARDLGWET